MTIDWKKAIDRLVRRRPTQENVNESLLNTPVAEAPGHLQQTLIITFKPSVDKEAAELILAMWLDIAGDDVQNVEMIEHSQHRKVRVKIE